MPVRIKSLCVDIAAVWNAGLEPSSSERASPLRVISGVLSRYAQHAPGQGEPPRAKAPDATQHGAGRIGLRSAGEGWAPDEGIRFGGDLHADARHRSASSLATGREDWWQEPPQSALLAAPPAGAVMDDRGEHPNRKVHRDRFVDPMGGTVDYMQQPEDYQEPHRLYSVIDPEGRKVEAWHSDLEGAMMRAEGVSAPGDRFVGPQGHTLMSLERRGWRGGDAVPGPAEAMKQHQRKQQRRGR